MFYHGYGRLSFSIKLGQVSSLKGEVVPSWQRVRSSSTIVRDWAGINGNQTMDGAKVNCTLGGWGVVRISHEIAFWRI